MGVYPGEGNVNVDPCFAAPGYWADVNDVNTPVEPNDPNAIWVDGDYHLLATSLCIDAGDPNHLLGPYELDVYNGPRLYGDVVDINDRVVDVGADEYLPPEVANIDGLGGVDFADYALFAGGWLDSECAESNNWCDGCDVDRNGLVNVIDLFALTEYWLWQP